MEKVGTTKYCNHCKKEVYVRLEGQDEDNLTCPNCGNKLPPKAKDKIKHTFKGL